MLFQLEPSQFKMGLETHLGYGQVSYCNSCILYGIMELMHILDGSTLYLGSQSYVGLWSWDSCNSAGVSLGGHGVGSQRSKVHFHQKCYFSYKLYGIVMGLMHIRQLDTLYKSYGSRNSPGVIWGHRGQKVIFTKNAMFLLQITWYGRGTHAYSSARYLLQKLWV